MLRYRLLMMLLSPLLAGHILWTALKYRDLRYLLQRFGLGYDKGYDLRSERADWQPANQPLWFHCASVGEVITLLPLIRNLHEKAPALNILMTTNTVTGARIVSQQKLAYLSHVYLPFDWRFAINSFLRRFEPTALYVMETEIWPNLYAICRQRSIPLFMINARLSSKTMGAKPWMKNILRHSLGEVSGIYTRSTEDAGAYAELGASRSIIEPVGNLKLCTALPATQTESRKSIIDTDREYVLLASTHDDEEAGFYNIWRSLERDELLVIAPRHPERAAAIRRQLDKKSVAVRSNNEKITAQTRVYLLDTIGELKHCFADARLVIMGGSFVPVGGHNILEPASHNCSIITGPYMENFREELKLLLDNSAICQVASYAELKQALQALLDDTSRREELRSNTSKITSEAETILRQYTDRILRASR